MHSWHIDLLHEEALDCYARIIAIPHAQVASETLIFFYFSNANLSYY
jgi:hypothetical protein